MVTRSRVVVAAMPARALLGVILVVTLRTTAFAQGMDVVQVKNGDRFTGDVSELKRGELAFSTAAAGTIDIAWSQVVRLTSTQMLDVELSSGTRYTGTISSPADGELVVQTTAGPTMPIPLSEIAHIRVVGATFLERTSGTVDFGLRLTNGAQSYTFEGAAINRTRSYETELTVSSWFSKQDEAENESRNNVELDFRRLLTRRWFALALGQWQQDDELELDRRLLFGGGIGRWLVDDSEMHLALEGGLDYTGALYQDADETDHSAEVFGDVDWHWSPTSATTLATLARTEISLDQKRIRLDFDGTLRRDIFWNLYWSVNAFEEYDSDPPDDRPRSSFGLAIGLGWTF
jgi:hypothetical protein